MQVDRRQSAEAVWKRNSQKVGGKLNQYIEWMVSDSGKSRLSNVWYLVNVGCCPIDAKIWWVFTQPRPTANVHATPKPAGIGNQPWPSIIVNDGRKLHRIGGGKFLCIISAQKKQAMSLQSNNYFRWSCIVSRWRQYLKVNILYG